MKTYRGTGATLPGADLWRPHGCTFEGWFWRFTDVEAARVVVVLIGVNRPRDGAPWMTAGIATHPGGFSASALVEGVSVADGVVLGDGVARFDRASLKLELATASIDVGFDQGRRWPRQLGGIGVAQAIPGLSQYWHPWLLGARVRGAATIDGVAIPLGAAAVYGEKNWGPAGFPADWWWGQAHGFEDPEAGVAFAGGRTNFGPATAAVVWRGDRVLAVARPPRRMRFESAPGEWRLRGGGVEIEGEANGSTPHLLPVPDPEQHRNLEGVARQHLAGAVRVRVKRGRRLVFSGESVLAGLELGGSA